MKAHHLMPLLLVGCCCLQPLRAQSNPPLTAQDAVLLRQWVSTERKLAIGGNADAQELLGDFYYCGFGVPQDYAISAVWLRKAAMQADAGAQGMLGDLYLQGEGVPQDYSKAYFWLDLALARRSSLFRTPQNMPQGIKNWMQSTQPELQTGMVHDRDEAASHLTRAELLSVQQSAEKWLESHKR